MPIMSFGQVPYPTNRKKFGVLPAGKYRAFCKKVEVSWNKEGVETWGLKMEVLEPREYAGSWVFDNLYWGSTRDPKANVESLGRCKLVCHRLGGLNVDSMDEIEVRPEDLEGKSCWIHTKVETVDRDGKPLLKGPRARVHFDGYELDGLPEQGATEPGVPMEDPPEALQTEPTPF